MDDLHELPTAPAAALLVVNDVDQLRVLSDPLRLRILVELGGPPRTTKQVADRFGEKPIRLYHHVETLEKAGLIRLMASRPKRGTLEKYYQAVARQVRVESSLFSASFEGDDESLILLGARVLETAADDRRLRRSPKMTQLLCAAAHNNWVIFRERSRPSMS